MISDDEPVCRCGHEDHWHDERGCFFEELFEDEDGHPIAYEYCSCDRKVSTP